MKAGTVAVIAAAVLDRADIEEQYIAPAVRRVGSRIHLGIIRATEAASQADEFLAAAAEGYRRWVEEDGTEAARPLTRKEAAAVAAHVNELVVDRILEAAEKPPAAWRKRCRT